MIKSGKTVKPITVAERNFLIQLEKNRATEIRLLKEMSRPKILIESVPQDTKPTSFYLQQAKLKFNNLKDSKSTRSVSAKSKPKISSRVKVYISQKQEMSSFEESKLNSSIPDWLNSRADFQETVRYLKSENHQRIPFILDINYHIRTAEDCRLLDDYLLTISFFKSLPVQVVHEAGNRLVKQEFKEGQKIIKKGDESDGLIIIFKGSVSVVIEALLVATKYAGEVVGETSLDYRMPRSADVIANSDCIIFKLGREDYETAILSTKLQEKKENNDLLNTLPLFNNWSPFKLMRLSALFNVKTFSEGQNIFKRNDPSLSLFFIKAGRVDIFAYVPMEHSNKWPVSVNEWNIHQVNREYLVNIAELYKGQYFGEQEVVKGSNRVLKAVAKTDVTVLELNREHLLEFFSETELENILKFSFTRIPDSKELKEKKLSEIQLKNSYEFALLSALQVNLSNVEGRDLVSDPKTKKLNNWIVGYKSRRISSSKNLRNKIVFETSRNISVKKLRARK